MLIVWKRVVWPFNGVAKKCAYKSYTIYVKTGFDIK